MKKNDGQHWRNPVDQFLSHKYKRIRYIYLYIQVRIIIIIIIRTPDSSDKIKFLKFA